MSAQVCRGGGPRREQEVGPAAWEGEERRAEERERASRLTEPAGQVRRGRARRGLPGVRRSRGPGLLGADPGKAAALNS